jgi:hypothetical protein
MDEVKETTLTKWEAPEYQNYSRSLKYYLIAGTVLLAVIIYSAYMKDWYAIVIFLILAGFAFWYQQKTPITKEYKITQLGIYMNDRLYPYNEIYSYCLTLDNDYRALNIVFSKKYLPELTVILAEDIDPVDLKTKLSTYIPEDTTRTESIVDRLSRLLRL